MELGVLYSGGKDSTLAAALLDGFYDVTLVTVSFGITDDWTHAKAAAESLSYPFETIELDESVAEDAVETMLDDGYPRNGIQAVHTSALEAIAEQEFDAIADGTRRDDRVPSVSRAQAQSIEDRHDVDYVSPLSGFGRSAVDRLVAANFEVTAGPSEAIPRADYEAELRALLADRHGSAAVTDVFPDHEQTYVSGAEK